MDSAPHLTAAEQRVLAFLPTYLSLEAVAERLGCKRTTVKTQVACIYKKLGARTRGGAVERAVEAGLIPPSVVPGEHGFHQEGRT